MGRGIEIFMFLSTINQTQIATIPSAIKENLLSFIEMFPLDEPQWTAIRQSMGAIADTPENYLRTFRFHFGLE